jgi:hypothetical protein
MKRSFWKEFGEVYREFPFKMTAFLIGVTVFGFAAARLF